MSEQKVDIRAAVEAVRSEELSLEDSQTKQQLEISDLKLQKLKLEVQLETVRLERLSKNNRRRPWLFGLMLIFIVVLYSFFVAVVFYDIFAPFFWYVVPITGRDYFHAAEVLTLALVPTVLLIVLVKAVFSPQTKEENKLTDVIPVKTVVQSLIDKNPT